MYIIHLTDPDNPGEIDETQSGADAAAAAAEPTEVVDPKQAALDAFDEGAKEAEDAPAPAPAPAKEEKVEGEPETDEQKAEREKAEAEAATKAEDDNAVKELGLKGKAEERFRDLTGRVRELSQKVEQLGGDEVIETIVKLGGKDGLDRVVRDAGDQRKWDEELSKINCTPQQFGQAIGFIAAFNSQDPAVWQQARENLAKELAVLDERLGVKSEHHDPLAGHPDLKAKVQKGAMDEEDALEVARLRAQAAAGTKAQEQTTQQQQAQQEQQQGLSKLRDLGVALAQRDGPDVFRLKMDAIRGALDEALPNLPPAQWVTHATALYNGVKVTPPVEKPRVGKAPVRQSHNTSGAAGDVHTDKPKSAYDAFDQGVAEAKEIGL